MHQAPYTIASCVPFLVDQQKGGQASAKLRRKQYETQGVLYPQIVPSSCFRSTKGSQACASFQNVQPTLLTVAALNQRQTKPNYRNMFLHNLEHAAVRRPMDELVIAQPVPTYADDLPHRVRDYART
eukprot:GEMP01060623.1.p2 GENE.GEMP01060623.1~~GEMP01060623.1.p2  ORF type:complete len:127 (-),score=10.66 GEMP01060623.1:290-670(-)